MTTASRETQLSIGPIVAAVGAIMLIVSLFLNWYEDLTGYTVFEFVDLLLTGLAVITLVSLAGALGVIRSPFPAGVPLAIALLALVIVLSQLVNDPPAVAGPDGRDQDLGIWLALGGSALMVAGAVLSAARIAIAVEPRERRADATRPAPTRQADEAPTVSDEPQPRP